ncbi:MAG: glycosyltransferase family 39 protein [Phycisphaeraceae bacterium]|nr:glycosyltransferase family 39 protein [Phycisphaeraceae bacterium]
MKPKRSNPSAQVYELAFSSEKSRTASHLKPDAINPTQSSTTALSEPRQTNAWQNLLMFVMLLLICLPVLLLNLGQQDVVNSSEASHILRSSQTWNRYETLTEQRGFSLEGLIPYENGQASLGTPPGLTWTHMIWFMTLDQHNTTPSQLILRARLCSVFFAVLALICIYWAGYSIGRHRTAAFSMLIFAANPVFIYYTRLATPTMLHTGWAMLAIATSLWAIRPLRPLPSTERQFLGWIVCGLALGAATLVAGPITLATIVAPIFMLILFCPDRVSHLIGLLASLLIGLLIVAPWLIYAHEHNPQVWDHWLASIISVKQLDSDFLWQQSLIRIAWLALAFSPWVLWILAVVAQPIS